VCASAVWASGFCAFFFFAGAGMGMGCYVKSIVDRRERRLLAQ